MLPKSWPIHGIVTFSHLATTRLAHSTGPHWFSLLIIRVNQMFEQPQILHYLMIHGCTSRMVLQCASNMSLFSWMIFCLILNRTEFHSFARSQKCHWWNGIPYATSRIVPNAMPLTPLPCMIAERFQICVTYIFASTKEVWEQEALLELHTHSTTEYLMSTGFQVWKYFFHNVV